MVTPLCAKDSGDGGTWAAVPEEGTLNEMGEEGAGCRRLEEAARGPSGVRLPGTGSGQLGWAQAGPAQASLAEGGGRGRFEGLRGQGAVHSHRASAHCANVSVREPGAMRSRTRPRGRTWARRGVWRWDGVGVKAKSREATDGPAELGGGARGPGEMPPERAQWETGVTLPGDGHVTLGTFSSSGRGFWQKPRFS